MSREKAFAKTKVVGDDKLSRIVGKHQPKNESFEHHFCKMVSQLIAYRKFGCRFVGSEVYVPRNRDKVVDQNGRVYQSKCIIDACGISISDKKWDRQGRMIEFVPHIFGFEAKASLADYRNGFSAICPYTYIICPTDIIPIDQIPNSIGLIYIDPDAFAYVKNGEQFHGVNVVKRARKRLDSRIGNDDLFDVFYQNTFTNIARANSIKQCFNPRTIPMYE